MKNLLFLFLFLSLAVSCSKSTDSEITAKDETLESRGEDPWAEIKYDSGGDEYIKLSYSPSSGVTDVRFQVRTEYKDAGEEDWLVGCCGDVEEYTKTSNNIYNLYGSCVQSIGNINCNVYWIKTVNNIWGDITQDVACTIYAEYSTDNGSTWLPTSAIHSYGHFGLYGDCDDCTVIR